MKNSLPHDLMPPESELLARFAQLKEYVELTEQDLALSRSAWDQISLFAQDLVDDFYSELLRHDETARAITQGEEQVARLKVSLLTWINQLFTSQHDAAYLRNRWMVGWRHVRIGLPQIWTATAMSRLRHRLLRKLGDNWPYDMGKYHDTASAICRVVDLDLMLIQDAYYTESVANYLHGERSLNASIIDTTEAIVLLLAPDSSGKILRSNKYLAHLVAREDELPKAIESAFEFIPNEDRPKLAAVIGNSSDSNNEAVITRLRGAGGRERTIRWYARYLDAMQVGIGSQAAQILLVGHDLTDLTEAQKKALQQERLAAIGQTMAGLAHESRNAFQRSQAALETLALELEDKPTSLQLVERIQRANDHLLYLYQEVLEFAKPLRLDLRRCQALEIVETTCLHLAQADASAASRIVIQCDEKLPQIQVDPFAIEQILRNLIENALSIAPSETSVIVQASSCWNGSKLGICFHVIDHGPGIPEEYRERVFEPFFSTRSRGTGLGLPIARRLAEAHGGSLELRSNNTQPESSVGTTAFLWLPEKASLPDTVDPASLPDTRRSKTS